MQASGNVLTLFAPNNYVLDSVKDKFLHKIHQFISDNMQSPPLIQLQIGSSISPLKEMDPQEESTQPVKEDRKISKAPNALFLFDNFVEGKSNQLARAAAMQVAQNPGKAY